MDTRFALVALPGKTVDAAEVVAHCRVRRDCTVAHGKTVKLQHAHRAAVGGGGFHHVCLKTRDWDRTVAFYCDLLGCKERITWRQAPQRAGMFDTGDGNYIEISARASLTGVVPKD